MGQDCKHEGFNRDVISGIVDKYGCYIAMIESDHLPSFAYSIGLYEKFEHPEIICFGLNIDMMGNLINEVAAMIKQGSKIQTDVSYPDFLENVDVKFIPVSKSFYGNYFGYGTRYYKDSTDFSALQLVWPDKENSFPWDEGFNPDWKFKQPLLDRNTDFKFYEERNLGVFTTKEVLEGDPVLYVYHDDDGDWQFHTTADPDLNNAILVCLEDIVKRDSSINELFDLQFGCSAFRTSKNDKWQRLKDEDS